jgi:WD40 repeat protein
MMQWDLGVWGLERNWGQVHDDCVSALEVSNCCQFVFTGSWQSLKFWDIGTKAMLSEVEDAHEYLIFGIAVSPFANLVFTVSEDKKLKKWDFGKDGLELDNDYSEIHKKYFFFNEQ